ncbi:MAG: PIN domain-containing protein [Nitrospirae bacterium]|nr:PIN domain-containing protein [Nitrospirota bacterium]
MQKLLIDTCLWIDWINRGLHEDLLLGGNTIKYMSSIVLMELYAGAHTRRDRDPVNRLMRTFRGTRRIVVPTAENYGKAGQILADLRTGRGFEIKKMPGLANDVLIALTARTMGAAVVTSNRRDFEAIRKLCPFHLRVVD